ncbi:flavin-containing monooxygenase [Gordonia sp. CPCC 205333]|uniref:flavin-containing monooxygenase n=1 Tax=Gordonia sp. CPCC 205333 TaxID=3140790 RepID=UPI003AF3E77F
MTIHTDQSVVDVDSTLDPPGPPRVAIIGAGYGGLGAAIELSRSGIDSYEVFERSSGLGGVWRANVYPGAACDIPSSIYSFSHSLSADWTRTYAEQREILDYLQRTADEFGVTPKINFNTEVVGASFVDGRWNVETADGANRIFDAVITASGVLSNPYIPDADIAEFTGTHFHSAEWDETVDLVGKSVVIVGSGASAIQIVPRIAGTVAHLSIVQRTPKWVINRKHDTPRHRLPAAVRRTKWYLRFQHAVEFLHHELKAPLIYRRFDAVRGLFEARMLNDIRREIADPELREKVTPRYKAMCNRILISSDWYSTLVKKNVSVHTASVKRLVGRTVELTDGTSLDADVVVWCTGFQADRYLAPIRIRGIDGRDLHEEWESSAATSYLGVALTGYPNLFTIFGPGTGGTTVNSAVFLLERQAEYIRKALSSIKSGESLDVRKEVQDTYNDKLAKRFQTTVYASDCSGWYSSKDGREFVAWPGSHLAYARALKTFDKSEYNALAATRSAGALATETGTAGSAGTRGPRAVETDR